MGMMDVGRLLIPPKGNDNKPGVTQWRWVICIAVALLLLNSAAGRGLLGGIGAYAAAADVQTILELQFATELRELQKQMCELPPEKRATLERVIDEYQLRYKELAGRRYPLKAC